MNYKDYFFGKTMTTAQSIFVGQFPYEEWPLNALNQKIFKAIETALERRFLNGLLDQRRCGNSTRVCDQLIQDLFTKGFADIFDNNIPHMKRIIKQRLSFEHGLQEKKDYTIKNNTITLCIQ